MIKYDYDIILKNASCSASNFVDSLIMPERDFRDLYELDIISTTLRIIRIHVIICQPHFNN